MTRSKLFKDEAFGIVPILHKDDVPMFLLIQHHAGHWGFPKGHADPGESALEAACREFVEETGIAAYTVLGEASFLERYTFTREGQRYEKTVLYFPALVQSATVVYQKEEIRAYAWANFDQAIARLTFEGARQVLKSVNAYFSAKTDS